MSSHATLDDFKEFFHKNGELIDLSTSDRIALHDEDSIFLIEQGEIDIYALEPTREVIENLKKQPESLFGYLSPFVSSKLPGNLHFLREALHGHLLIGFSGQYIPGKPIIIAHANQNTLLRKIKVSKIQEILRKDSNGIVSSMDEGIRYWINSFSHLFLGRRATEELISLPINQTLSQAENTELAYTKTKSIEDTVIWLDILSGGIEITGLNTLTLNPNDFLYPLPLDLWFQTITPSTFSASVIKNILNHTKSLNGLRIYQKHIIDVIFFSKLLKAKKEFEKIKFQEDLGDSSLQLSMEELDNFEKDNERVAALKDPNPIFRACQKLGEYLNLSFIPLTDSSKIYTSLEDYIYALCHRSEIAFRRVTLSKNWWCNEHEPFLAFKSQIQPIAIEYESSGDYLYFDIDKNKMLPLAPEKIAQLEPWAYVFYRKLPDKKEINENELLKYLFKNHFKDWFFLLFFSFISVVFLALIPFLTRQLFSLVIINLDYVAYIQIALAFLLISFSEALFCISREFIRLRLRIFFDHNFSTALWQRILKFPHSFFQKSQLGDLLGKVNTAQTINRATLGQIAQQLEVLPFSLLLLIPLFYYKPALAIGFLFVLLFMSIITLAATKRAISLNYPKQELTGIFNTKTIEILAGLAPIRIFGSETNFFTKWEKQLYQTRQYDWKLAWLNSIVAICNASLFPLTLLFVFSLSVIHSIREVNTGVIGSGVIPFEVADFMGFFAAYLLISSIYSGANLGIMECSKLIPLWKRAVELINQPIESTFHRLDVPHLSGELSLDNVDFRYDPDSQWILNNISLHAKAGELIGIVGKSGSGKSTIARLLIGFERPENGAIYYDRQDLTTLNLHQLRSQIGTMIQTTEIIEGTIRENVALGRIMHDDRILQALEFVGFHLKEMDLPEGLDTCLVKGGAPLPSGDAQCVLLARSIVENPRILILDEPYDNLDGHRQELISKHLADLKSTRIVITQRPNTLKQADRIYVIDQEKIVDSGSYEELLKREGVFQKLII